MKHVYESIKTRIETEVPEILHVRLYNSQFDNEEKEHAFPYPCLFIEFENITYNTAGAGVQYADINLKLHLGYESYLDEDLGIFDLRDKVQVALQGYQSGNMSPLKRIAEKQDSNHNNVMVWTMDFNTNYQDSITFVKRNYVPVSVTDLEIQADLEGKDIPLKEIKTV